MTTTDASQGDTPGLPLPPPILSLLVLLAAIFLDWLTGLAFLPAIGPGNLLLWLGVGLCCAAAALAIYALRSFQAAGTNVDPRRPALTLVTGGPYRFTRNPMYVGQILLYLGLSLIFSLEWGLILLPVLWLAFDRLIVAREERYLERKFGAPFTAFLGRTRRWL